jgi:chromosome segregation ATPase
VSEMNGNGTKRFEWRTVVISGIVVGSGWLVQWGISTAKLAEHDRQLEEIKAHIAVIEARQEQNLLSRTEYDKRHEDLIRQVEELRQEVRELEHRR